MIYQWEEYLALEHEKMAQSARQLQTYVDKSGLSLEQIERLASVDLEAIDPELRQQLEMEGGVKMVQLKGSKPVPDATSYRQKRHIMAV